MAVEAHARLIAAGTCWVALALEIGIQGDATHQTNSAHGEEGLSLPKARLELRTSFETRLRPSTSSGLQPLLRMSGEKVITAFLSAEYFAQDLHIWEISVHASAQGRGIGRRLIEAVVTHAREIGLEAVTLTTFREVAWNEPYYVRLGFETLSDDALSPRLRAVLDAEIANGLPGERRCAMRLSLD